jgi:NADH-quinone oxidoreductase subunit M
MKQLPLLSLVIFLPLLGAAVTLFLGRHRTAIKAWTLAVTLGDLALAGLLWGLFQYGDANPQFVDQFAWIESLGIDYSVGLDGISLWLVLLTAFLSAVAVWASFGFLSNRPEADWRSYFSLLLALETGVLGVFAAIDLVLFFVFWEAMLIPAYFLIGWWGGQKRQMATTKFVLYTMAGSALMLVGIIALAMLNYQGSGVLTFDRGALLYDLAVPPAAQPWLFLAFALAFAVKAPVWPLHSWQPDAYVEAPTPVTILLAGVLSKMGIYGMIRFCLPTFSSALEVIRPWIWLLAICGIVYGSLVALVQRDMKRLLAYSSLAHMGLIFAGVLSLNAQGIQGAILQSVSHGLTVTALFLLVDWLEARRGTREVNDFGGLWKSIPIFGSLLLTVLFASVGLPGLSGFPGEFALMVAIFQRSPLAATGAALGIILGAWYMLNLFRRTFSGPLRHSENRTLPDLRRHEAMAIAPLVILMFVIGILPNLILRPTDASTEALLKQSEQHRVTLIDHSYQAALAGLPAEPRARTR